MARKNQIFNNTSSSPTIVATKSKSLLLETLENHFSMKEITLLPEENKWTGTFIF
jgi:hypothetical protein